MEALSQFWHHLRNLDELIRWGGLLILVAIVFAETGLLAGFFLPGDSLLVMAGIFAARGDLEIVTLIVSLSAAAIIGDTVGYWFGAKTGPRLFARPDSRFFKREHLLKTKAFYEKHGGKTIVLARFMPFIRTFAPVVAGVAQMEYRRFLSYNVWGGIFWVTSMCLLGYSLGTSIPPEVLEKYIHLIIGVIILLSILPAILHVLKERRQHQRRGAALPAEQPEGVTR